MMMGPAEYIIELKEITYRVSGNRIDTIQKFEATQGDKFVICNFPGAITKVMTIESPVKYAEAMVIRKLHEEGEFDEPVSIVTHLKRKRGDNSTEIFFTAIASKVYSQYLDRISECEDTVILFPLYSALFNLFKKLPSTKPVAVVFRHGTYADILVGTKKRIFFTSRCTGFDTSPEQVSTLWDMVARDISVAEEDNQVELDKVICINWIDTHTDEKINNPYLEYLPFDEEEVLFDNETCQISFLKVVKMLSAGMGTTNRQNMFLYYSRKVSYIAALVLLIISLGLLMGQQEYSKKTQAADATSKRLSQRIEQMKKQISSKPFNKDFNQVYSFVNQLYHTKKTPSFKQIIHDIEIGAFQSEIVENLKITYSEKVVTIKIYGKIKLDFDNAYKGYQALVKNIENKGYTIAENSFNAQIDGSEFRLIFSRSLQ